MATLGTDPELFVGARGEIRAVCGKLGGTKGKPINLGGGLGVQEDNVMLEFNIEPVASVRGFARSVRDGVERVVEYARDRMGPEIRPLTSSEIDVPSSQLVHPLAKTFGCSQDFDAHARGNAAPAVDPELLKTPSGALRFAGGHVHMGYNNPQKVPEFVVASLADVFLGLPSVTDGDEQLRRRGLYGQPGRYRPTSYGIEYRVLSNYWIWHDELRHLVGSRAMKLMRAIESCSMAELQNMYKETPWADVRRAIATNDTDLSYRLWDYLTRSAYGAVL